METVIDIGDGEGNMSQTITKNIAEKLVESGAAAEIGKSLADNVLDAGSKQAKSFLDQYTSVDTMRPYFDVEPAQIRTRLLQSLRPQLSPKQNIPGDLYGPLMLVFTLAGILLMGMKAAEHRAEGTLMGKAFGVSFGFWIGCTGMLYFLCFVFNTKITFTELLSTTGYGMFGFCLILLLDYIQSGQFDFFLAWLVLGSLSALKVGLVLKSRTEDPKQGMLVAIIAFLFNWVYAYHLHYSYAPPSI
eukprot:m.44850 g.44850  ORF g.44850 m.44850 type:complete len:245 (+) comp10153_c0_seq1:195-929(+)